MAICIFPGTFNPIHEGHLKMAEYALSEYNFEKIVFIPSYIPPHKNLDKNLANARYNMVKIAISKNSRFEISDIEYSSEEKSYTLITVKKLLQKYNTERLNMIIGTDAFLNIRNWYKVDELKSLVHFIVFPRNNDIIKEEDFPDFDFEIANMKKINISSTELRGGKTNNIKEVEDYVEEHGIY